MLSALITVPPSAAASCSANADLPLAVGPAISTNGGRAPAIPGMNNVLTLIGNAASGGLPRAAVALARSALDEAGARMRPSDWLAPDLACDIPFDGLAAEDGYAAVAQYLADAALD